MTQQDLGRDVKLAFGDGRNHIFSFLILTDRSDYKSGFYIRDILRVPVLAKDHENQH